MGFIIALAIIALILLLKISVRVDLADDTALTVGVGIFRIKILPSKPKTLRLKDYRIKKFRKVQEKSEQAAASAKQAKSAAADKKALAKKDKKTAAAVKEARRIAADEDKPERDILGLIEKLTRVVKVFITRFGHHLHIKLDRLFIVVATGDAAKTAVMYGSVCGAVQCFLELLYNCMHLTLPKGELTESVGVAPDFLGEKMRVSVDITISFRLWQLFDTLIRAGWQFLKKVD